MAETKSRNTAGCLIVIAVLLLLLMAPIALFWLFLRSLEGEPVSVSSGTVLEVDLSAVSGEGPGGLQLGPWFGPSSLSLFELIRTIDAAAEDDDIVAIRIVMRDAFLGWAGFEAGVEAPAEFVERHAWAAREAGLLYEDLVVA